MNPDTYIAPVATKLLDIIQRHATYLISASSYVENLKKKREMLDAIKVHMDAKIEGAERKAQKATNEVVVWKKQVDDILRKIDEVVNAYETRSCLCAICSDYKTGHHCDGMIKEVDRLLDGGNQYLNAEMMDVDNSKAPIAMRYVVPGSLEFNFQKAMEYIEDVDSKANVLGIWGTGGVGKTTLMKKIHNSITGRPIFSHVIWTVASSEQSNISRIQSEIAKELKLKLDENDDVQSKARKIHNFLMNKNFLLFIDDLWEAVDLYEAGVPNPYEEGCGKNSKTVFTTRSKDVCGRMGAKTKILEVMCLDRTQSWDLFKENVGEDILSDHRISEFAKGIVEECKGLPLALVTIGQAMSIKSEPADWKYALKLMKDSQGHNLLGSDKQLLSVLKISYDFLPCDQLRKCFLTISLWPEDCEIREKELTDCWMGLDIIDNFESMEEAYQIGHSLIERLLAASLLEMIGDKNDRVMGYVKMHDVLRDLALWIASDCGENRYKWMVKAKTNLQYAPSLEVEKAECISFIRGRLKELPSGITRCSNLLTLILTSNHLTCESISDSFHNFPLLKYLDLSRNKLDSFPEAICDLTELQYLNLSYNRIQNIPKKLGNLKKLTYLMLRFNPMDNVPRGVLSEMVKLLVLDLYSNSTGSPLVIVEELKWLEKKLLCLGISVSGDEVFNKLLNMSDLSIVDLHISNLTYLILRENPIDNVPTGVFYELVKLLVLDLYQHFNSYGSPLVTAEELKWLEKKLLYLGITVWSDELFNKLLNLSDLSIVDLLILNLRQITSFNFLSMIPNPCCLMHLGICECSAREIIFERNHIHQSLPNLEELWLNELIKLERIIWKDIQPEKLFTGLKKILLFHCILLDDITWVIHLPSLLSLYITSCDNMRIAMNNKDNDNNIHELEPNILTFPSLRELKINDMKNLEKISTHPLAFPELYLLVVRECPLLKTLPFEIESTPRLKMINGEKDWLEKIEWKDDDSKSRFSQLYVEEFDSEVTWFVNKIGLMQ